MVAEKIASLPKGANQHRSIDLSSQETAAEMLNVSVPSVKRLSFPSEFLSITHHSSVERRRQLDQLI
jgi:hypothetical protein